MTIFIFQEITCLYDDNVEEVMWGLKNNMGYLVLEEKTVLAKKVCLPMSKRFEMFLSRYGFDMKPEMVSLLLGLCLACSLSDLLLAMQCWFSD
jgi:hypothetical protein